MDAALYWTIWIALALFAASECLKSATRHGHAHERGPWLVSAAGLLMLVVHIATAMAVRHGWSHEVAIAATARQTRDVYGLDWGGGYFVNYVFVAAWFAELIAWRRSPEQYLTWSGVTWWTVRAFYFVMIANAAIVFAAGWRRGAGIVLVVVLLAGWRRNHRA